MGFSSFTAGRMNISGLLQSGNDITTFGAQLNSSYGGMGGSILSVAALMNSFDAPPGVDDNNYTLGAGIALDKKTTTGLEWCPGAQFLYTTGDFGQMNFNAGVSLGKALAPSGGLTLAPFGTIAFTLHNYDADGADDDTGVIFGGGLGLRFDNGLQLTPSVWKDASITDSDMFLRITVTWPLK
jgi:hypothetical protein